MEIHFKKGKDGQDAIRCIRADGSSTWARLYPSFIGHDLAHYAVETVLQLKQSFFGLVQSGWNITEFEDRHKTKEGLPLEAVQTEFMVNLLQTELAQGEYFGDFNAMLRSSCESKGVTPPPPISETQLLAIRESLHTNLIHWRRVKPGERLILVFRSVV